MGKANIAHLFLILRLQVLDILVLDVGTLLFSSIFRHSSHTLVALGKILALCYASEESRLRKVQIENII